MDSTSPLSSVLLCSQCGGELHPDEGQAFITCPYCSSTVYIDKAQVVFHWYVAPTLDETQARASLARWMAGSQTVKDLDHKANLVGQSFEYFPVWYFKRKLSENKEEIVLEPAAATSVTEVKHINLPAGDLRKYESSIEKQSQLPTVPLQTALTWAGADQKPAGEMREKALVHIPLYTFKYAYKNQSYTAVVEAATGSVIANIYPAKDEAPFLVAGALSALVFIFLAILPVIGYLIDQSNGIMFGLLACGGLGIIAAPLLFGLAVWVAAKI